MWWLCGPWQNVSVGQQVSQMNGARLAGKAERSIGKELGPTCSTPRVRVPREWRWGGKRGRTKDNDGHLPESQPTVATGSPW